MKIFLRKTLSGFTPADEASAEAMRHYKLGEVYRADIVKPRSYKHHKLFMALLTLTFDNQEKYTDPQMFRRAVALEAGHVDQIISLDGEPYLVPLSYDYDTVPDEAEFTKKFGAAMTVCCRILGDMGYDDLLAEVSRYADEGYWRAA